MGKYLVDKHDPLRQEIQPQELRKRWTKYQEYLSSVRKRMPAAAYAFAAAKWHYDWNDERSLHGSRIDRIEIVRVPSFAESDPRRTAPQRHLEIHMRLLGPHWNGFINLRYKGIISYSLSDDADLLYDEVRLAKDCFVIHE